MKKLILIAIIFIQLKSYSQGDNIFLQRTFWKEDPQVSLVKEKVSQGHDPSALNRYAFDGVIYALLENVNNEVILYLLSLEGNEIEKQTHDGRTYIFWAAYAGNTTIMKYLLDKGAMLNIRDSHGNTPITFAAATGQLNETVYILFEEYGGLLVNHKDERGADALLLIAPYVKDLKTIDFFIKKGLSIQNVDKDGNGIFNYAAKGGNKNFINELLKLGVTYRKIGDGGNAFIYASMGTRRHKNNLEFFQYLESLGINPNTIAEDNKNPLHRIAYSYDDKAIFDFFINKGVSVCLRDENGRTPFLNAASNNKLAIVSHLIEYVDNINVSDSKGRTAISLALRNNDYEVVEFLIDKGANTDILDTDGNSLANYVLEGYQSRDSISFDKKMAHLSNKGVSMIARQNKNNTLLHLAVKQNNIDLIKRVLAYNIPVNSKNDEGLTALHIAAMKSSSDEILKLLINNGADKNIRTDFDETVLELALENELMEKQVIKLDFLR